MSFLMELEISRKSGIPAPTIHQTTTKSLFLMFGQRHLKAAQPPAEAKEVTSQHQNSSMSGTLLSMWKAKFRNSISFFTRANNWAFPDWTDIGYEEIYKSKATEEFIKAFRLGLLFQIVSQIKEPLLDVVSYCNGANGFKVSPTLCSDEYYYRLQNSRISYCVPFLILGYLASYLKFFTKSYERMNNLALVIYTVDGIVSSVNESALHTEQRITNIQTIVLHVGFKIYTSL
jgi:hypothetical protein